MKIEFNNQTDFRETKNAERFIFSVCNKIEKELKNREIISAEIEYEVSIALIEKKEIKEVNFNYRKKNEPTDILSFGFQNNEKEIQGELILCPEIIWENAVKDGVEPKVELVKNLIHGFLHISGYEHGEEMFGIQELIFKKILSKNVKN